MHKILLTDHYIEKINQLKSKVVSQENFLRTLEWEEMMEKNDLGQWRTGIW